MAGGTEGVGGKGEEVISGTGDGLAGAKCQSVEDDYVFGKL